MGDEASDVESAGRRSFNGRIVIVEPVVSGVGVPPVDETRRKPPRSMPARYGANTIDPSGASDARSNMRPHRCY